MEKQCKPNKDREQHSYHPKHNKFHHPLAIATRITCGLILIVAATLVLLNIFGVISLAINIGILVAITALAIIAAYSAFHLFWAGFFFLSATIVVIMNANGLIFSLEGVAIGNLFIAAALATIAFHLIFKKSAFTLFPGHSADATFGTAVKYFDGELDTARLECNFGSVKAYLENAEPKDGKATIDLECNFGSIELYVPKSWKITDETHSTFARTEEKNHPSLTDKSPELIITGELNFGGLVITYA